jgi:transcriptional regulator with PAS, ATPase and Fis domain
MAISYSILTYVANTHGRVTAKKVTETSLSIQSVIDTHQQPFLLIDQEYCIVAANKAFEHHLSFIRNDIIGMSCYQFFTGQEEADSFYPDADDILRGTFSSLEPHETVTTLNPLGKGSLLCRLKGYPVETSDNSIYLGLSLVPLADPENNVHAPKIIGKSRALLSMMERLTLAAESESPVLLTGESGTGKELAAEFIHNQSGRKDHAFITVDCTVLGEHLFESQLFGHEKGAFTGSTGTKQGLFELADGGTLFLDEIGEIPIAMQPKLLRALETGSFRRVGGTSTLHANVRIICATNRDLPQEIKAGQFREDLYFRFAVFPIHTPALRERMEDLPLLAEYFLDQINASTGKVFQLSYQALDNLSDYYFPGNIRELRNLIQLAAALSTNGVIRPEHLQFSSKAMRPHAENEAELEDFAEADDFSDLEKFEARQISGLLAQHHGNRRKTATSLGISERTLYRKLKKYKLNK